MLPKVIKFSWLFLSSSESLNFVYVISKYSNSVYSLYVSDQFIINFAARKRSCHIESTMTTIKPIILRG